MRRPLLCPLLLLALATPLRAGDDAKGKPPAPAEQYQALLKEYRTAEEELVKAYRGKTEADHSKVLADYRKTQQTYAARFLELAKKHPKEATAIDALAWVVQNSEFTSEADQAVEVLIRDHLQDAKVGSLTRQLAHSQSPASEKLLRAYLDKSTRRDVQAEALLNLAQFLKNKADVVRTLQQKGSQMAAQAEQLYGKEAVEKLQAQAPDTVLKEAEELVERVVEKYADVKSPVRNPVDEAKPLLFELRHLAIGKVAPDIEGEDIDGQKFKLSDYRGKVVVLDFWGHW